MRHASLRGSIVTGGVRRAFFILLLSAFLILVPGALDAQAAPGDEYVFGADSPVAADPDNPQTTPAISGESVVWQGRLLYNGAWRRRIQYKDISNPENPVYTLVPKLPYNKHQSNPRISGNLVVWLESTNPYEIHYTFLNENCPGSCQDNVLPLGGLRPVAGSMGLRGKRIVFEHYVSSSNSDIYLYDLDNPGDGPQPITTAPGKQIRPHISDSWISYFDVSSKTVRAVPLGGGPERSTSSNADTSLGGNSLYFTRGYMGKPDVGVWRLDLSDPGSEPERISGMETYGPSADSDNGEMVVWESTLRDSGDQEIYLHNLATGQTQRVSASTSDTLFPAISGTHIVWADDRDAQRNIYQNRLGDQASTIAERYKPELFIYSDDFIPVQANMLTDIPGTMLLDENDQGWATPSEFVVGGLDVLGGYNQANYPGRSFYLNLRDDGGEGKDQKRTYNNFKPQFPAKMYARVARDLDLEAGERKTVIQYWFCYYFNDRSKWEHEGDWEMVQVNFDSALVPELAVYSQHSSGEEREWADVWGSGSNPQVFVGDGSHANYFTPGRHLYDHAPGPGDSLSEETPAIEMVDTPATAWLDFDGHWGEGTFFSDSPSGPLFNALNHWNNPLGWWLGNRDDGDANDSSASAEPASAGAGFSLQTASLLSSSSTELLVNIYDSFGRRTGKDATGTVYEQIPDSEYLSWSDGSGTAIVRDSDIGSGYIIEVEVTDVASLGFELNLPQFGQGLIDKPVYSVTSSGPMKGRVTVAPEGSQQDYTMYLDTDGDGQFDDGSVIPTNVPEAADFAPPATISDLAVSQTGPGYADLVWTAPGDDGISGQASEYEIRYSLSPIIDEVGWINATPISNELLPGMPGSQESLRIEGLAGGLYYFAVRSADKVNNQAELSNSAMSMVPAYSYADDFEDGVAAGWLQDIPSAWMVVDFGGNKRYQANSPASFTLSVTGPAFLENQAAEADVTVTSGSSAGIVIRSDDPEDKNFYYFGIYPGEGKWKLYSVKAGWWGDENNMPKTEGTYNVSYGSVYRLKAIATGNDISLLIDNTPLDGGSVSLTDHPWGRFGVAGQNAIATFDNVDVQQS